MPFTGAQLAELTAAEERVRGQRAVPRSGSNNPSLSVSTNNVQGRFYVAGAFIPRGTLLFSENPLIIVGNCETPLSNLNVVALNAQYNRLEWVEQQQFQSLYCPTPRRGNKQRRFEFNNFEIDESVHRRAVILQASFFNHSCFPDAYCS